MSVGRGWIAYKQQGLYYQRGEQFTVMVTAAVPTSRDVISETSHSHFCSVLYANSLPTLDVFVSSNVFHFNAVLSVCWAVKSSDEL